jgi:hypothetical protein
VSAASMPKAFGRLPLDLIRDGLSIPLSPNVSNDRPDGLGQASADQNDSQRCRVPNQYRASQHHPRIPLPQGGDGAQVVQDWTERWQEARLRHEQARQPPDR